MKKLSKEISAISFIDYRLQETIERELMVDRWLYPNLQPAKNIRYCYKTDAEAIEVLYSC